MSIDSMTRPIQEAPTLGLLTRTVAQSPSIRWILRAHLRRHDQCDLIFIGDDFIQIHELTAECHLRHLFAKYDFGCRINSAAVIGDDLCHTEVRDSAVKLENDELREFSDSSIPSRPQFLLLTLDSAEVISLYLHEGSDHALHIEVSREQALPASSHPLERSGKILVVDPKFRAIATTVSEGGLMLKSSRHTRQTLDMDQEGSSDVLAVESSMIRVQGTILQMEFLHPPPSDPGLVVLLVVVASERKTLLQRIDWVYGMSITTAQVHSPQRFSTGKFPCSEYMGVA